MSINKRLIAPTLIMIASLCWPSTSSSWADFSIVIPSTVTTTTLGHQVNLLGLGMARPDLNIPGVDSQYNVNSANYRTSVPAAEAQINKLPEISLAISEIYNFLSQG